MNSLPNLDMSRIMNGGRVDRNALERVSQKTP